ncbi:MAG: Y4bD/Y4pK family protein [Acidobacteria bacterium]|nr:Y4bD/Y4pK family protein [Acidobacteriota bacterium]
MVHPHHPLKGQKFRLITHRHNWSEDRVYFHDAQGALCSIPACWTTVAAPDPFVQIADGRCFFRYEDLLQLVSFVEKLR